jgi:hypothetical protein
MTYEEALQLPDLTPEERNRLDLVLKRLHDEQPEAHPRSIGCDFSTGEVRCFTIARPSAGTVKPVEMMSFRDGVIQGWNVKLSFEGRTDPVNCTFLDQQDADHFASTMVFGTPAP